MIRFLAVSLTALTLASAAVAQDDFDPGAMEAAMSDLQREAQRILGANGIDEATINSLTLDQLSQLKTIQGGGGTQQEKKFQAMKVIEGN